MSKRTSIRRRYWRWNRESLMPSCWLTKNVPRPASQSTAGVKQQKIRPFLASLGLSQPTLGPNILPSLSFKDMLLLLFLPLYSFSLGFLSLLATLLPMYKPWQKIANYLSSSGSTLHVHLFLAVIFLFDWWNSRMFWFSNSIYICVVDRKGSVAHEHMQYMDFEGAWMWIYNIFVCMCARIFSCLSVCARCSIWQSNDFIHTWCISVQCQYGLFFMWILVWNNLTFLQPALPLYELWRIGK